MVKKIKKLILLYSIINITVFTVLASSCAKIFWDYNCIWYSTDPYIEFVSYEHEGKMRLDGIDYEIGIAWDNTGYALEFYDNNAENPNGVDAIIWCADCKIVKEKLYLTVTLDNLSDYKGKTIILEQRPLSVVKT